MALCIVLAETTETGRIGPIRRASTPISLECYRRSMPSTRPLPVKERDLAKTARLYLEGHPFYVIAQKVGRGVDTVSRDVAEIRERWRVSMIMSYSEAVAREVAKLDAIEVEAWDAWRRSVGSKRKTRTQRGSNTQGDVDVVTRESWVEVGDPRFLEVARKCSEDRRKLLGLDAPDRLEIYGSDADHRDHVRTSLLEKLTRAVASRGEGVDPGDLPS
jgi:hypothetical protein